MPLQLKDCLYCFEVLHSKEFESCWMFDHSCGHDQAKYDGLNISNMGVKWGREQATLCNSKIIADNGFLGPHNPLLKVNNIQQFNFQEDDDSSYYLKTIQRDPRKNDIIMGKKRVTKLKKDPRSELDQKQMNMQGKTTKELQQIAALHNLPINIEINDIQEGWVGKPKGIQHILWEQGLLDPSITYTTKIKNKKGKRSEARKVYGEVLAKCHDFQNELTSLQHLAQTLDSMVNGS